jgi:HEAT repeat protein
MQVPEAEVPALMAALDDPAPGVRSTAALALGQHVVLPALPGLLHHLLHDEARHVRRICVASLHGFPTEEVVGPLCEALQDADHCVRSAACIHLGLLGDPRAIPSLVPLLDDPVWNVRINACWALVKLGTADPRLESTLEQLTQEPEAVEWDLQAEEMDQWAVRYPPEEDEPECTASPKIADLLAEARRLARSGT